MTPQSNFTIIAPIIPGQLANLNKLLDCMTKPAAGAVAPSNPIPGMAHAQNPLFPFSKLEKLHTARFVILDDRTSEDLERIGEPVPDYPTNLAFMGDCDGPADKFLADMVTQAGIGLRQVFSCCQCFDASTNLLQWLNQHSRRSSASYVNHVGRTALQIQRERILREKLSEVLRGIPNAGADPQGTREKLVAYAKSNGLVPKPQKQTPPGWLVRNAFHFITLPIALGLLITLVLLIPAVLIANAFGLPHPSWFRLDVVALAGFVALLAFAVVFRLHEVVEPELVLKPTDKHAHELAALEDHDVVNQFSVIGSVKPSAFRRGMLLVTLWIIDWVARHLYGRGNLARIRSIHFARWVLLDGNRRVLFASTYDGSLESYNDDFINKAGFGLNLAFGAGLGYPRTNWLLSGGANNEQKFKYTLRRHQIPTQVWYNAYPGLTVYDLARNSRVRDGIERTAMSNAEICAWLADL